MPSTIQDLFVATAGASAALAGLVFVAVSINVDRILKLEGIPERALETVLNCVRRSTRRPGTGGSTDRVRIPLT